jgi:hypothetical protein
MAALFVSFLFVVVLCVVGGLVVLASRNDRHRLIASAPPGALVGAEDTSAEAQAKLAQYRSTLEAALFLTVEERRDIKAWLENFYGRGPS